MTFHKKTPEWKNVGAEPPEELKKDGFKAGYKPPAAYFNWFFNRITESVKELQTTLTSNLKALAFKDEVGDADIVDVSADKVMQDTKHRMLTDAERTNWDAAHTHMSDGVRHNTAAERTSWNTVANKVDKVAGKQLSANDYTTIEKKKLSDIEPNANNYIHSDTHPASIITEDIRHRFVSDTEKAVYVDKYTKNEVDNKFSLLETAIDWKESVAAFADIASTYPAPKDGWTVNVRDTDYTYRYSGSAWIAISANAIPKATQTVDGLLTKEDKKNYDDTNTKKHIHSNKTVLDVVTQVLVESWSTVTNKVDKISGKQLSTNDYTTAEKNKLTGVAAGAEVNVQPDWNVTDAASDAHIKNKPSVFPPTSHTHGNATISDIDASKIKTGIIDIERLPKGALERCVVVANNAARFALTAASVQTGDTVKVTDSKLMYFVVDDTKLSTEAGYTEYTAGQASAVPWSGVTGKPTTFQPASHTHGDKVTASGGDIADTKVASFTAPTTAYPVPAVGDTIKVAFGKIKKFFEDMNTLRVSMLFIGNLVNNGQTTLPGFALDARYGKTLADQITQLNSDLGEKINCDTRARLVIDATNKIVGVWVGENFETYLGAMKIE